MGVVAPSFGARGTCSVQWGWPSWTLDRLPTCYQQVMKLCSSRRCQMRLWEQIRKSRGLQAHTGLCLCVLWLQTCFRWTYSGAAPVVRFVSSLSSFWCFLVVSLLLSPDASLKLVVSLLCLTLFFLVEDHLILQTVSIVNVSAPGFCRWPETPGVLQSDPQLQLAPALPGLYHINLPGLFGSYIKWTASWMAVNIEDGVSAAVWIPRCQDMSVSFWNGLLNLLN